VSRVSRVLGSAIDGAADALVQATNDWEDTFNTVTDMITVHDADFNIVRANKAAMEGLGLPNLVGLLTPKCFTFYHGTTDPPAGCPSCACLKTGQPAAFELFEPHLNAFLEIRAMPRMDGGGKQIGLIHVVRNVAERKQAEARIEHLNRVLRAIREVNQLIVRERDPLRLIQETCGLLVERRGYGCALIILTDEAGRPLTYAQAGLGESFEPMAERLRQGAFPACCDGAPVHGQVGLITDRGGVCAPCPLVTQCLDGDTMCIRLADGNRGYGFLAVSVAHALGGDSEEQTLFGEVAGDIAFALHSIEQGKAIQRVEKEGERIADQLRQAQKMEAVGRLAGGVAHDFNNILQATLSLAEVLRSRAESRTTRENATEIEAHLRRGAGLTQQLLLFSRQQVPETARLDLGELVKESGAMLRRLIPANILLSVEVGSEHLWTEGNSGQLHQVLMNLTVNARDAMSEGGKLAVRTGAGAGEVWVEVEDSGLGMSEEVRKRIFEPFFSTKETGRGTGLGLAVVYGIVKQHRGRLEVASREGEGSRFRVSLLEVAAAAGAAEAQIVPEADLPMGSGESILVVEDEEGARHGLTELLGLLGYTVTAVGSGEQALALPEEPQYRVLLADLMLPGIPGPELAHRLAERWPGLAVILMSGYTEDEAVRRGVEGSTMRFLQKPFDMAALARGVHMAVTGPPSRPGT
jgi:two-component system, cell cycle sensor histidine kinase and response regulator CckA